MVSNIDFFQQLSTDLHEHTSLAITLLAMQQETIKHTSRNITLIAYHGIEISGSDSSLTEERH